MKILKAFVCCILFGITNSILSCEPSESAPVCSSIANDLDKLSAQELIARLASAKGWPKRKEMITLLIQKYRMSPNEIRYSYDRRIPLREAALFDDLPFAQFLLTHNANANSQINWICQKRHVLYAAETKAMADLLFAHGAHVVETPNDSLVGTIISHKRDPNLIPLYVAKGAQVNAQNDAGYTPLLHVASRNHLPAIELKYVVPLMQAGALLTPKVTKYTYAGYNAPMLLKKHLNDALQENDHKKAQILQKKRDLIKNAYETLQFNERHVFSQELDPHLYPVLANIVTGYAIETYDDLENQPVVVPQQLSPSSSSSKPASAASN